MRVSWFRDAYAPDVAAELEAPFEAFLASLRPTGQHTRATEKERCYAFSAATFAGGRRAAARVEAVHFGVLDLDDVSEAQLRAADAPLRDVARAYYSTWRHDPSSGLYRLRAVFELSRPVTPAEWPRWRRAVQATWPLPGVAQCLDPGRIFFAPSLPLSAPPEAEVWRALPGGALDVDALLATVQAPPPQAPQHEACDAQTLAIVAERMARAKDAHAGRLGRVLRVILQGDLFAEPGERDNLLWNLAIEIARQLPNTAPEAIAEHFRRSLDLMGERQGDAPTVEVVADKIRRAQAARAERVEAKKATRREQRIKEAFLSERVEPYTQAELNQFYDGAQCSAEAFEHRWVIQHGGSFYFYRNGEYAGPYPDKSAHNAALRDLAPSPVELYTPDGERRLLSELVERYGSVATAVSIDLRASRSYYDAERTTIVEASCPIDPTLTPAHCPIVDRWLRALGGPKYHYLEAWLTWVYDLERPLAALVLTGEKGAGKSFLASCLARFWKAEKATPFADAISHFNSSVLQCPLVFADEEMPKNTTQRIREFVQSHHVTVHRKYLPDATANGSLRTIIAANSITSVLGFDEELGSYDIEAIAERFLHIPVTALAREVLEENPIHRNWPIDGTVARHVLSLPRQPSAHRFLVRDPDSAVYRVLATKTGLRGAVCNWLVAYLLSPGAFDSAIPYGCRIYNGQLLVTARGISHGWRIYQPDARVPSLNALSTALQAICTHNRLEIAGTKYRVVDIANLVAWCAETEYASEASLLAALTHSTESRIDGNRRNALHAN